MYRPLDIRWSVSILALLLMPVVIIACQRAVSIDDQDPNLITESEIEDFVFQDISVPVGATVIWTNMDQKAHTVTSGLAPNVSGLWGSLFLEESDKFSYTFTQVGEFHYWCRVHPFMTAVVNVQPQ